jgi:NTE family protein
MENKIEYQPKILILSGGGPKGIAYVGVLEALYQKTNFDINKLEILSGSSIGGVICFAICLGYTISEMKEWFLLTECSLLCPAIYKNSSEKILPLLYKYYSLSDGYEITKILINLFLLKKIDEKTYTFEDLYQKTGKLLVITGSNLTLKKCDYFSYLKTPKMKIIDALLITTRIPYIFPYIKYNEYIYVDGHLFDPFPVKGCGKQNIKNKEMLGIQLIPFEKTLKIENIKDFTFSIMQGLSHQYIKKIINKYKKKIINIKEDNDFFNINIDICKMKELFNKGFESGVKYVEEL